MLQQIRANYNQLSTLNKRLILALLLFFDSLFLGLSHGNGALNILDSILLDKLPTDLIWLLQFLESLFAGFLVVKIFFDDIPKGSIKTFAMFISPLLMVGIVF